VQNLTCVQPEIKMADVYLEVLVHEIAGGICVKSQRNPLNLGGRNTVGRMLVLSDARVSEKSKMAACNRSGHGITSISACIHDIATKFQRLYIPNMYQMCSWS